MRAHTTVCHRGGVASLTKAEEKAGFHVAEHTRKSGSSNPGGRSDVLASSPAQPSKCPECGSVRTWKDGLRYTNTKTIQRWLCRDCGFRFSQTTAHRLVKLNITSQVLESSNSGKNFAERSILNINTSRNKTSEDPSFSFGEDVRSHNNPLATIVGKELNGLCHYNRER